LFFGIVSSSSWSDLVRPPGRTRVLLSCVVPGHPTQSSFFSIEA
jgi:hypothetical protein